MKDRESVLVVCGYPTACRGTLSEKEAQNKMSVAYQPSSLASSILESLDERVTNTDSLAPRQLVVHYLTWVGLT